MNIKSADLDDLEDLDICYNCKYIEVEYVDIGYCMYKDISTHYTNDMCEEGEFK